MRPMASTRERLAEVLQAHGVTDESAVAEIVDAVPPDAAYRADYVSLPVLATLMAEMSNRLDATINAKLAEFRGEVAEAFQERQDETAAEFKAVRESIHALDLKLVETFQQHQAGTAAEFKTVHDIIHALDLKLTAEMKGLEQRVDASLREQNERISEALRVQNEQTAKALRSQDERISEALRVQSEQTAEALRQQSEQNAEVLRVQSEQNAEALRQQSEQNAEGLREQNVRNAQELREFMENASDKQRAMQWRLIGAIIGGAGVIATVVGVVLGTT